MTEPTQEHPALSMDELISHHENQSPERQGDQLTAATFYNQVGSELIKMDNMAVDSSSKIMKLDPSAIVDPNAVSGSAVSDAPQTRQATYASSRSASSSAPVVTSPPQPGPPPPAAHGGVSVTISHDAFEKQRKQFTALKSKVTKLDKEVVNLRKLVSTPNSSTKYKIVTDSVDSVCTSTDALISIFLHQLTNKAPEITITKC